MRKYQIQLDDYVAAFYEKIANAAGLPVEQVLSDTLYRTAGELAQNAIGTNKNTPRP